MADRNLVLQLLITAKDEASAAFGKLFGYLDDNTKVIAGKIREAFSSLFSGGVASAAELEAAFDAVAAKGGYTAKEMEKLQQQAAAVAAQFGVTGKEAAQGLEILAAAGLNAKDAVATLPSVLALAKSEGVALDVAAEKLADSLAIMGLGFDEAGRMADVLAKGANLSTVSATQLAESLSTVGGIAKAAGLSLEETVAALDLLAKNGIKGERAGTALQAILTALQNPASAASQALNNLGISTRDLGGVLDGLNAAGAKSETAILAFGETAGPGLRALIGEGSSALVSFTTQLQDAEGAALAAADGMSGNLQSALSAMNAALETVKQTLAEPLLEPLAKAARSVSDTFNAAVQGGAFSGLTDAIKLIATVAGETAEKLVKAFDFKAVGASINSLVTGGMTVLGQAMNNVGAIAGALAAGAIIPLIASLKAATTSTLTWIAAQRTLAASMTATQIATAALNKTMAILAGPAGWILAGVSAFALLWKEEDKAKAALDALALSTDEYTKKLKEQTRAQNQVALNALNAALDEQRQKLTEAKIAYDQVAQSGTNYIVVTEDHGAILGKTNRVVSDANEVERIRQERLAEVDRQTQLLNATESRRKIIIDELKAKQDAANPAMAAAAEALGKYQKAVEAATDAQARARDELDRLTPGTLDYGKAAGKAALADENLKQAKEVLIRAESEYHRSIQESIRGLVESNEATLVSLEYQKQQFVEAQKRNELEQTIAQQYAQSAQAAVAVAEAERVLAKAKGDSNVIAEATLRVAEKELAALQAKRIEQDKELQSYQQIAERIADLTERKKTLNDADAAELAALQEKYPAIGQVVAARQADVAATDKQIEMQQREARQAEVMAGPIGQLIRLYEQKTAAAERETSAIERSYASKQRDLDVEIAQAEAKGDSVKASELKIDKAELEAEAARALADALAAQMAVEIEALEAKKLDIQASDLSVKAKAEEIAQINELIAKKREQADAAQDAADVAKASADQEIESAKKSAQAVKDAAEAAESAERETRRLGGATLYAAKNFDQLTEAGRKAWEQLQRMELMGKGPGEVARLIKAFDDLLSAEIKANAEIDALIDTTYGIGPAADHARQQLLNMARTGNDGIRGLTSAGEAARQKLQQIRDAALEAEQALAAMADDFRREMLQIQGDQRTLLQLEQQDRLAQLEAYYRESGELGAEEYRTAKARAEELHRLKLQQLDAEQQADTTDVATQRVSRLADEGERAGRAMNALGGASLAQLNDQADALRQHLQSVNSLL